MLFFFLQTKKQAYRVDWMGQTNLDLQILHKIESLIKPKKSKMKTLGSITPWKCPGRQPCSVATVPGRLTLLKIIKNTVHILLYLLY